MFAHPHFINLNVTKAQVPQFTALLRIQKLELLVTLIPRKNRKVTASAKQLTINCDHDKICLTTIKNKNK